jgi:hypothetical protein
MAGEVSRRKVVAGLAALGATGLAGCRGVGDGPAAMPTTPEPPPEPIASQTSARPTVAPALLVPVICRDAWGAVAALPTDASHVPVRITLHHTAAVLGDNRKAPGRLRQHQRFHQDSGFSDIAYHVGVDRNGHVYELRDARVPGETFTDYDPSGHFLVLAEGEFDTELPSDAQLEGLAQVIAGAARRHRIPVDTLTGHRDHAGTACPGDNLYARMADLGARASELLDEEPDMSVWCDDAALARVAAIERGEA